MLKVVISSAGVALPALPDPADSQVQVWRDNDGAVTAYGHTVGGEHWMHFPELASFRFGNSADEVIAIARPSVQLDVIRDTYQRCVLPMVLQVLGQEALHASAVQMSPGVVAFCGTSQTGKSTIAYALRQRGYPLWADDIVAFQKSGRSIRALSLPFRSHLRPAPAAYFGHGRAEMLTPSDGAGADQFNRRPQPLAAICILMRAWDLADGVVVHRLPLSTAQAFPAVLAHGYCFSLHDVERKRRMMCRYLDLTARVPVFEIRFQDGLDNLPTILDSIERSINRPWRNEKPNRSCS